MTTHEWRGRDDDNQLVYYRAKHHSGEWTFHARPKKAEHWVNYDEPPLEILEEFREVLWNKIQRRRAPEKLIDQIDKMLEEIRAALPDEDEA